MKLNDPLENLDKKVQTLSLQFREKYEETWDEPIWNDRDGPNT